MAKVAEKMLHGFSCLSSTKDRTSCVHGCECRIEDDDAYSFGSTNVSDEFFADDASSSSEFMDDASTSSSSSPSNIVSSGPLSDLSSLMASLPIKRGLSNYFEGKSKSFASLGEVSCVQDLVKRKIPLIRKMKIRKSYASCPDGIKHSFTGACRKTIVKKSITKISDTTMRGRK